MPSINLRSVFEARSMTLPCNRTFSTTGWKCTTKLPRQTSSNWFSIGNMCETIVSNEVSNLAIYWKTLVGIDQPMFTSVKERERAAKRFNTGFFVSRIFPSATRLIGSLVLKHFKRRRTKRVWNLLFLDLMTLYYFKESNIRYPRVLNFITKNFRIWNGRFQFCLLVPISFPLYSSD